MYCYKCDKNININKCINSNYIPEVFNIMNYILNNFDNFNDIYNYLNIYRSKDIYFWIEKNKSGITVFHLLVWYIGIQTTKYKHFKQKILHIFLALFGMNYNKFNNDLLQFNNNTNNCDNIIIKSSKYNITTDTFLDNILNENYKNIIFNIGTNCDQYHTIYHHLNQYCENKYDIYYKEMYNFLLNHNSHLMNDVFDNNNKTANDYLPQTPSVINKYNNNITDTFDNLSLISNKITSSYKNLEKSIISYIESKHDFNLTKCQKCRNIIDFSLDIPNIINYAFSTYDYVLINLIIKTYQLRSLLNNLYLSNNLDLNKNKNVLSIDNRHKHVINIYKTNINKYINIENYITIIE